MAADLLLPNRRESDKFLRIQVFTVQMHCMDLSVFVGGVVVDTLIPIAAGGVQRSLILSLSYFTTSPYLLHRPQNVKKLTDAFPFPICGSGIFLYKSRPDEPGLA